MISKPIVLVMVPFYLPSFKAGGPVRSIANLVDALGEEFDFKIVCSDRDLGDEQRFSGLSGDKWERVGLAHVLYVAQGELTIRSVARLINDQNVDAIYLNSFFSLQFTIFPLLAQRLKLMKRLPIIIAPRGEISAGALSIRRLKKRLYIAFAKAIRLFSNVLWQASTSFEADDLTRFLRVSQDDIYVAINLPSRVSLAPPEHKPREVLSPLRVIFLSRIATKKNLDFALRVLRDVKASVCFSIYGPVEDPTYHRECLDIAESLPPNIKVDWFGPIESNEVASVMARHDLFFLPTKNENFGHVIAEAVAAGTPLLLSDNTPWRGLAKLGIGHDLPLAEPQAFVRAIECAALLPPDVSREGRARVFAFARERELASDAVEANRRLLLAALDHTHPTRK